MSYWVILRSFKKRENLLERQETNLWEFHHQVKQLALGPILATQAQWLLHLPVEDMEDLEVKIWTDLAINQENLTNLMTHMLNPILFLLNQRQKVNPKRKKKNTNLRNNTKRKRRRRVNHPQKNQMILTKTLQMIVILAAQMKMKRRKNLKRKQQKKVKVWHKPLRETDKLEIPNNNPPNKIPNNNLMWWICWTQVLHRLNKLHSKMICSSSQLHHNPQFNNNRIITYSLISIWTLSNNRWITKIWDQSLEVVLPLKPKTSQWEEDLILCHKTINNNSSPLCNRTLGLWWEVPPNNNLYNSSKITTFLPIWICKASNSLLSNKTNNHSNRFNNSSNRTMMYLEHFSLVANNSKIQIISILELLKVLH